VGVCGGVGTHIAHTALYQSMLPTVTTVLPIVTDVIKHNYNFRITQSLQANEYGHL